MRILCFAIDLNTSCYMLEPQYAHLEYHGVSIAYSRLEYIRHFIQWCNMQYARIFCRSGGVGGGGTLQRSVLMEVFFWAPKERGTIWAISTISARIFFKPLYKVYIIPRLVIFVDLCSISASGFWNASCTIRKSYRPMLASAWEGRKQYKLNCMFMSIHPENVFPLNHRKS